MAVTVATVMANMATALDGITGLRVFGFPPKQAQAPFAFINPTSVAYDLTMGRGQDRLSFDVYIGVANSVDRVAWGDILSYADGTDVKAVIEALGTQYRVTDVTFGEIQLAASTFLGAVFTVDYAG